jgi:hypothetical protein
LLQQLDFELFAFVNVVDGLAFNRVKEALLTLQVKLFFNFGECTVVSTNDGCSSLTIENQCYFSKVITLIQKFRQN